MGNDTVVFTGERSVSVEERDKPTAPDGGVLIRTRRTLLSVGTELSMLNGDYSPRRQRGRESAFPVVPGYSNIGQVESVGRDVDRSLRGTRVATPGPHQQYLVAHPDQCRVIPESVSDVEAAFFRIAEIVMNGLRRGEVDWGESVAIFGLGVLGQMAVRLCEFIGARPVVGIGRSNVGYLPNVPGVVGIETTDPNWREKYEEATGGAVDVVIDTTGNPDAIQTELDLLDELGRFVLLGSPRKPIEFDFYEYCNAPSFELIGAHHRSHPDAATNHDLWTEKRHAELFFEVLSEGRYDFEALVSHSERYSDAASLYDALLENRSQMMCVQLEW